MSYEAKPRPYAKTEDRNASYRDWRYGLGKSLYCCDIDQVEIAVIDGCATPVGILEITLCTTVLEAPTLLEKVWERLDPDGDGRSKTQTQALRVMARRLDIPAVVVVYQENGQRFATRRFDKSHCQWHIFDKEQYMDFLFWLRERRERQ